MALGQPSNATNIIRVTLVVSNKSWLCSLVDLPQFDSLVLSGSCNPRMPVFSTENDILVACKQTMEGIRISIHNFSVATVGNQKHVIRWLSFGVFDIDDLVVIADNHHLQLKRFCIDDG